MNGSRFPFPSFPTGWYNIGASAQVRPGGVVALDLLGRELVCYRGASGRVAVIDAFCPHLGAHIGVGGHVEEDDIVCPFHGWRFDTSGRNVDIPYRDQANKRAALFVYPVRELAGMIFIWFDLAGHPPRWDLPVLPELEYPDYALFCPTDACWRFESHPQEVLENVVDLAHFKYVHGVTAFGDLSFETSGPMCRAVAEVNFVTSRGSTSGAVSSELWGLGIDVVRHQGLGPPSCGVMTVTPIDGVQIEARYMFVLPTDPKTGAVSRYGRGLIGDFMKQITQDIPIWERKIYRPSPSLAMGEGPIMEYRRWARQFYGLASPEIDGADRDPTRNAHIRSQSNDAEGSR